MINYKEFLQQKGLIFHPIGFDVSENDINPMLFPFQKDIVRWALKKGRACLFEDCGLGKTAQQLEWAYHISKREKGSVLIVAPLAVAEQTVPVWMDIKQGNTLNFRVAREKNDERHICPLQLQVIARCLELWTNPGDIVFSPFAGIGSEGYESVRMGRKFIGIELKESYYLTALRHLKSAEKHLSPMV